jgi:DNA-binding NarL/FixJ family response regulator
LILLDISLPGRSGIDLLKELRGRWPRVPVLVFSSHPEEEFAIRVLRAGAAGYLHKGTSPHTVLAAIRTVLDGGKYISPTLAAQLAANVSRDPTRAPHELLSDRELDVMLRIAAGRAVGEIAEELDLSVKTVSTYRTRILQKTGMKSNAELVQYAVRNKLVS